jgi:hypothetical protein
MGALENQRDGKPTVGVLDSVPQNDCPDLLNLADVYERP